MPEVISGTTLSQSPNQDQLVIEMRQQAALLYQDSFAFETMLRMVGGIEPRDRMESNWREDQLMPVATVTQAVANAGATSIKVATANLGRRNMRVFCPKTRESFVMDEDIGGTAVAGAIKVRKQSAASGTGIVTAIPSGTVLFFGPTAQYEGEGLNPAFSTKSVTVTTYIQEMQEQIVLTNVALGEKTYGKNERDAQRKRKMIEQMQRLEGQLIFGASGRETVSSPNGERTGYMPGLVDRLGSRAIDASAIAGGVTLAAIGEMLRPMRSYGIANAAPVLVAGSRLQRIINSFPAGAIRETTGERKSWGVTVSRLLTDYGPVDVLHSLLLSEDFGGADLAFFLTPDRLKMTEFRGNPLTWKTNVQDPTEAHNIVRDLYFGSRGFELYNPELHQMVYNIS